MSDAQKLIAAVLLSHISRYRSGHYECQEPDCDWQGATLDAHAEHQAAEIDKALGGLTRETLDKPEFRETGEMIPNPLIVGPELVPERRLHFIPSERWVSTWSEVQS